MATRCVRARRHEQRKQKGNQRHYMVAVVKFLEAREYEGECALRTASFLILGKRLKKHIGRFSGVLGKAG